MTMSNTSRVGHFQVAIRTMGNSKGVLTPKPIIAQTGLLDAADLQVADGVIEVRQIKGGLREGWAAYSERVAGEESDKEQGLAWPEFDNADDASLQW